MFNASTIISVCCVMVHVVCSESAASGSVSGTVVFEGKPPVLRTIRFGADPLCEAIHVGEPLTRTESVVLGEGQTLANVLVEIVSPIPEKEYPIPTEPFVLTQKGCLYSPHILALRAGQPIRILNPDKMSHNIHFFPEVNREFNRSMNPTRKEITHTLKKPEPVFTVKCEVHTWMQAHCAVYDHPFFAVTAIVGTYSIDGLPPGEYKVKMWHERFGEIVKTITVPAEGAAAFHHAFTEPKK